MMPAWINKTIYRWGCVALSSCFALPMQAALAANTIKVPLVAEQWQAQGVVEFVKVEGIPQGLMVMKAGTDHKEVSASLKSLKFGNGTIAFDVKPVDNNWPTIRFRQRDAETAEEFYIRPSADCAVSQDCLQYAPKIRGRMLWDSYIQYQKPAPFNLDAWNHIKLVISGRRMNVYVNGATVPNLVVDELAGDASTGSIELQGPAIFANLTITPDAVEGLPPEPAHDPSTDNPGYVRTWQLAEPQALLNQNDPVIAQMPAAPAAWHRIDAERDGLINLARCFGPAPTRAVLFVAWLQVEVDSDRQQTKSISIGWSRKIWVFVNGKLAYAGQNLYNTPGARQEPDGRLSVDNGRFDLQLQKGRNQVAIAISSNTPDMKDIYGFGFEFRFDDIAGLKIGG